MATMLKGLEITSTDLVDQGANPDAHIRLFKSVDGENGATSEKKEVEDLEKEVEDLEKEVDDLESEAQDEKEETDMGKKVKKEPDVEKSRYKSQEVEQFQATQGILKREMEGLQSQNKEYVAKVHTLEQEVETLKKSLTMKELENVAKQYEVIGKRAEDLAPVLYQMKESGQEIYETYVKSLDEQVDLVGKRDLFGEIGSGATGTVKKSSTMLGDLAQEICKRDSVSMAQAMVTAFEENPTLAMEYEQEMGA